MRAVPYRLILCLVVVTMGSTAVAQDRRLPTGKALDKLVEEYLQADESSRQRLRDEFDATYAELKDNSSLKSAKKRMRKIVATHGKKLETSGTHYFYDEGAGRGKYIVQGSKSDTLFIGLHGGGAGAGSAENLVGSMGGGGWIWIFPEVLEKTEHGWVDSGTDQFVLELVEAAKRTFKIDPNRIYVSGLSMGGDGTWALASHHPDVFAGGAAYCGAPTPVYRSRSDRTVVDLETGLIPNLYRQTFYFYQSGDDPKIPPEANDFAFEKLKEWQDRFPDGFRFRYERVEGRGHRLPSEGCLPSQEWVASHEREPLPKQLLWQPTRPWKRQFYWLYWDQPQLGNVLQVEATGDNRIEITMLEPAGADPGPVTLFLREPLVDLDEEVTVLVNCEERFRGTVARRLSTLLWTLPANDEHLWFAARVDVPAAP